MDKKGVIIITERDRETHLNTLLLYLNRYFSHIPIIVVQQVDKGHWNKGLLYNAAVKELGDQYDYYILHDVDHIPDKKVDYSYTPIPTLLCTESSQYNYGYFFDAYFGGVIGMTKEHYYLINGFSNLFTGYGGEDDNAINRFKGKGIQPVKRMGNRFEVFAHPKPDVRPGTTYYHTPEYQNNLRLAVQGDCSEGLSTAQYKVISNTVHKECTHLRIDTCQQ